MFGKPLGKFRHVLKIVSYKQDLFYWYGLEKSDLEFLGIGTLHTPKQVKYELDLVIDIKLFNNALITLEIKTSDNTMIVIF